MSQRKDGPEPEPEPCQVVLVWLANVNCIAEIAETGAGVSETGLAIGRIWYTTDERTLTPCGLWPSGRGMRAVLEHVDRPESGARPGFLNGVLCFLFGLGLLYWWYVLREV